MATITTKETRAFNWANPGTLKVGDEIVETLKDGREVVFVVMDDGVIGAQCACLVVGCSNGKNLDIGCFVQVDGMSCIFDSVKRRLGAVGCEDQRL